MASRFQVTPVSDHQAVLIEMWANGTGRSVSSLCASLLDQAVTEALAKGEVPNQVVDAVEELFAPERELARLTAELAQAKIRNASFISMNGQIARLKEEIEDEKTRRLKEKRKTAQ